MKLLNMYWRQNLVIIVFYNSRAKNIKTLRNKSDPINMTEFKNPS